MERFSDLSLIAIASTSSGPWIRPPFAAMSGADLHQNVRSLKARCAVAGGGAMPNARQTLGGPWTAHPSGSYLSIGFSWLALFGPRPGFIFSTRRTESEWLEWTENNRRHGLARFAVEADGTVADVPILASIPERKKPWVSSRQFGGRC